MLIADFDNRTGDPVLKGTLEPTVKRALEGAGFISAFDRSAITRNLGIPAAGEMGEEAARELAVKQGLNVVVSGSGGAAGQRLRDRHEGHPDGQRQRRRANVRRARRARIRSSARSHNSSPPSARRSVTKCRSLTRSSP